VAEAPRRSRRPLLAALGLVGLVLAPLPAGYEPAGGDPARIFLPVKAELARALRAGGLPFWSDRFGAGVPLLAESHAAALYPPNWALYRLLGVDAAYRLSMWLHHLALAGATFAYARRLGIGPWGGALAAVSACLSGPLAAHATHEWAYHALPFLPLALLLADRHVEDGRAAWLALLALALGAQWLLGHFQVQAWTNGLVLLAGAWRAARDRRPPRRVAGLALAVAWGGAIAAAQLGPSWELARVVRFDLRPSRGDPRFFSFPPAHWAEPAVPGVFARVLGGAPESPYWTAQASTGFEARLYAGTIPLILAAVALVGGRRPRGLDAWCAIVPLSFAAATLPRWWPGGYDLLMAVPGLNLFRAPARYTFLTAFGLALLAGAGLDRAIRAARFRAGLGLALALGAAAAGWSAWWFEARGLAPAAGWPATLALGALGWWALAVAAVAAWRLRPGIGSPLVLSATAAELACLYHGSTAWARPATLPGSSPVLSALAAWPGVRRVGGDASNLPVLVGLPTARPYLGFDMPPPASILYFAGDARAVRDPSAVLQLRRLGVTHLAWAGPVRVAGATTILEAPDPTLDRLADRPPGGTWRVARLPEPWPEARAATRALVARGRAELLRALMSRPDPKLALYLPDDDPGEPSGPWAARAEVLAWDGREATVAHDGAADLVVIRTHYPGWLASVDDGPWRPTRPADAGLQAVRVEGSGTSRVRFRYRPSNFDALATVSILAASLAPAVAAAGSRRAGPAPAPP
jgi:hypothetical protein